MVVDLSIVVVSNDEEKLNSMLLSSLARQKNVSYELITINGRDYNSASAAYNEGAARATCDVILFVHHDIIFTSDDALFKILQNKSSFSNYSILGVAGVYADQNGEKHMLMTIKNGPQKQTWSYYELSEPQEVFSIDECAFLIERKTISNYKFGDLGNTWHLYAVELCLHLKSDGHKVGVIPADLWHCSLGYLNSDFFKRARILAQRYKKTFPVLYTTCITIDTTLIGWRYKLLKAEIKRKVLESINR